MKKFITIIFATIVAMVAFSVNANAQERVNRPEYSFNSIGNPMTNITHWAYFDVSGKWRESNNGYEDIISMTPCKMDDFLIVEVTYKSGCYEYPEIKEDWVSFNVTFEWVLSNDELMSLINLEDGDVVCFKATTITVISEDENIKIRNIKKSLAEKHSYDTQNFKVKRYKDSIRFIFESLHRYSDDLANGYFEVSIDDWVRLLTFASANGENV